MFTCGAFGVYLRWFRLHSARVNLSIPPVAPADVPAIFHPKIRTFTCGALGCLPTVFRPRGAVFTCGADIYLRCKNISYRARYRPLANSERKRKGAKVTPRPQRYTEQIETDRRARCGGTIEVGAMYEDCKRKRVGEDFSAFVHTKTAKAFGNY